MCFLKTMPIKKILTLVAIVLLMTASLTACDLGNIFLNNESIVTEIQINAVSYLEEAEDISGASGYVRINNLNNQTGTVQTNINSNQTAALIATANEGYIFEGWYTHLPQNLISNNNVYVIKIEDYILNSTTALYFYAHFIVEQVEVVEHQVEFVDNENSTVIQVEDEATIGSKMPNNPSKTGYTFIGWNTLANGSGQQVTANTVITQNLQAHALWQINTYTVNFDANGGTISGQTSFNVAYNELLENNMPALPTRTEYAFLGWKVSLNNEDELITSSYVVTQDLNLYAIWLQNFYTLTFYATEDADAIIKQIAAGTNIGQSLPFPATRVGYNLVAWSTSINQFGNYISQSTVPSSDMTLYGRWTAKSYTIIFDAQGGLINSEQSKSYTIVYDTSYSAFMPTPVRSGYSFIGWNTLSNGTGDYLLSTGTVTTSQTFYAIWGFQDCTLTYSASGGTIVGQNMFICVAGSTIGNKMPANPTKTGYTFLGWSTYINSTMPNVNSSTVVEVSMTLYAVWRNY